MRMSWPIRRVLSWMAIHLAAALPQRSSNLPAGSERATHLLSGLAPGGVYLATAVTDSAGGLLHHRFTLTSKEAVCFLLHVPAGHPGWALPTTLLCGARTFLGGVPPDAATRPAHSRH